MSDNENIHSQMAKIKVTNTHRTHCGGYICYLEGFDGVIYMEVANSCSSSDYRAMLMDTDERVIHAEVWDRRHGDDTKGEAMAFLGRSATRSALEEYLKLIPTTKAIEDWFKKRRAENPHEAASVQQMARHFGIKVAT